jgi:hypothetical protein
VIAPLVILFFGAFSADPPPAAGPGKAPEPTRVASVLPSADVLPENTLRFYLLFSGPMSRGEAYRHIRLREKATGAEVDGAFLELGEELWDRDQTRFTLLFDPGRIKRGLKPREELGPALREGGEYALEVDRSWRDASGNPLAETFTKTFRATGPDETSPDPKSWTIAPPKPGTTEPLQVESPEPLDPFLFARKVKVLDADGKPVAGNVRVEPGERVWALTPKGPWRPGTYTLRAEDPLEDVAGNRLSRAFEVDRLGPLTPERPVAFDRGFTIPESSATP